MHTEKEAREMVCCSAVHNTVFGGKCMGSLCMAWRWCEAQNEHAMEHFEMCAPDGSQRPDPIGYCGLAGTPETLE